MCVMKLRMQTLVILASLRNNFVMGGHYSTNFVSENDAVEGRTKVNKDFRLVFFA